MDKQSTAYFPMFIDLSEKQILVVGGGNIATRRVQTLASFSSNITVIAIKTEDELRELSDEKKIELLSERFVLEEWSDNRLGEFDIIIAATDDHELNAAIAKKCKELRILVNVIDDKSLCDFYFPGIVKRDEVVVGVTASGSNHKLVKEVREKIEEIL